MTPGFAQIVAATARNRQALRESQATIAGLRLAQFRLEARKELLGLAESWTAEIFGQSIEAPDPEAPLLTGGHQPELFHTGVWLKNFAVHQLGQRAGGTGLNLIVDNDLMPATSIAAPAGSLQVPHFSRLAFDADQPLLPWEDAIVRDPEQLKTFGDRAGQAMSAWGIEPLLTADWPGALAQSQQGRAKRLDEIFAGLRIRRERVWGVRNLELPLSQLCESLAFRRFAVTALRGAGPWRAAYNSVLHEYRRINRIRSRSHPVPDLAEEDDWIEAPFWIWKAGAVRRERLFVRQRRDQLELRLRDEVVDAWSLAGDPHGEKAAEALGTWSARGLKLRTRALTTTLFARLCLADLFVHGIGGAKYDEMTDQLFGELLGAPTPELAVVTGTLHLPLGSERRPIDAGKLKQALRDCVQNPERHLHAQANEAARELLQEKRLLIEQQEAAERGAAPQGRSLLAGRQRLRRFREIKAALAGLTADDRERLERELIAAGQRSVAERVLFSREYSSWLFPAEMLADFFLRPLADEPSAGQ